MNTDYTTVTEVPGIGATREQMSMLYTRYYTAATLCEGKDTLEVACGCGLGLGYLAAKASRVVGGDYTDGLLRVARSHYGIRIPLVRLDAHLLPFRDQSFDRVILFEAIYYLEKPDAFLDECYRLLRSQGVILICTVNREWQDLNPSPFSTRYFSAQELGRLLEEHGFGVELFAAFPVARESIRDKVVSLLKRTAVALHLIPKTMKGKEWLKRLFLGKLEPMPAELTEGLTDPAQLVPIDSSSTVPAFKVIYAVGHAE